MSLVKTKLYNAMYEAYLYITTVAPSGIIAERLTKDIDT